MAHRNTSFAVLFSLISVAFAPPARAEDAIADQPQVPNSKFEFEGKVNSNSVAIRSGPGENYYPTARLERDAIVRVVGKKFEWLKIVPPPESYSVVAKAFITRDPAGSTGRALDTINVRAGSKLSNLKVTVQCKLKKDDPVTITGEVDEYYMIKPPPDAYVYIHQKFVDPVRQVAAAEKTTATKPSATQPTHIEKPIASTQPATKPVEIVKAGPTPAELRAVAENEFGRAEQRYELATGKPLESMPTPELISAYQGLLKNEHLPLTMRQTAQQRVISLKVKDSARQELLAAIKRQEETATVVGALALERQAIAAKLLEGGVFTAVGLLKPSTLQAGEKTLYRLTDPATERTLCYVRSEDPRYLGFIDKFVGVKGEIAGEELNLKVVVSTHIAAVDPAMVNKGITAQIVPPSLVSNNPTPEKPAGQASATSN